ncbi:hypothetical protein Syun_007441 [Stephania yunnanensis]|uniref:Uncharacterized protein n=1 Tax=Stephania yunnanensis TaxID=152371 RepID=A0AAP0L134_9MAGN
MSMHIDQLMNARLVVELGVGLEANKVKGCGGDGEEGRIAREEVAKVIRERVAAAHKPETLLPGRWGRGKRAGHRLNNEINTSYTKPYTIESLKLPTKPTTTSSRMSLPVDTTSPRNYTNASANGNAPSITSPPPPNAPSTTPQSTPRRIPVDHLCRRQKLLCHGLCQRPLRQHHRHHQIPVSLPRHRQKTTPPTPEWGWSSVLREKPRVVEGVIGDGGCWSRKEAERGE